MPQSQVRFTMKGWLFCLVATVAAVSVVGCADTEATDADDGDDEVSEQSEEAGTIQRNLTNGAWVYERVAEGVKGYELVLLPAKFPSTEKRYFQDFAWAQSSRPHARIREEGTWRVTKHFLYLHPDHIFYADGSGDPTYERWRAIRKYRYS